MPDQRGAEDIAKSDAASGRQERHDVQQFRDEGYGGMYCDLCWAGPFVSLSQRQQHEYGSKHYRNFRRYQRCYVQERDRIKSAQRINEAGRQFLDCRKFTAPYLASAFWTCGDLSELKASMYDLYECYGIPTRLLAAVDAAYMRHVLRVQADLLMLAYIRVHLVTQFDSMEQFRDQCVAHEQLGLSRASLMWKELLGAASIRGSQILELVMPWIPNAISLHPELGLEHGYDIDVRSRATFRRKALQ